MKQHQLAIIAVLTAIILALFSFDRDYSVSRYGYGYQGVAGMQFVASEDADVPVTENVAMPVVGANNHSPLQENAVHVVQSESPTPAGAKIFTHLHHTAMTALAPAQLPPLDAGMVNVTSNVQCTMYNVQFGDATDNDVRAGGYRMHLPVNNSDVQISIPYDPSLLPQGFTEDDIQTYVYDRQYHRWVAIQRDSVNEREQLIYSRFTHDLTPPDPFLIPNSSFLIENGDSPLDFINAVLKTPEIPETSAYTPTSIKELKAADPLEGLTLMQPPTANNSGTANLSYPIEIPAGRQGMQPNLALTYSSGGGNGWLGVGWDISIPSITVETRWGVPRYDANYESETYLLNGEQLATKDSSGHYEPLPHRVAWKSRETTITEKQFYPRVEGSFQRIIRHGTTPKNYWWEVRDKQGIVYYYGKKPGADKTDPSAVLTDNSGNIAQWMLTEIRDLSGNYVLYKYQTIRQGNSNNSPRNIYPKEISYTLHDHSDTNYYSVKFFIRENDYNPTDDGRYGFLRTHDKLLEAIVIELQKAGNSYNLLKAYTFCYDEGKYHKALLKNIGQIIYDPKDREEPYNFTEFCGSNANLVTHEFEYYAPEDSTLFTGKTDTITIYEDSTSYRKLMPFRAKPSPLGGTYSESWSVGGALTLGYDYFPASKSLSVGGNYMYAKTKSESAVSFLDIDGDGLPDKVFVDKDGNILYRRMALSGNNCSFPNVSPDTIHAGVKKGLLNATDETHDWGLEAHVKLGPIGASAAYSRSSNTSTTTTYLCDMDADGLPDLVSDGYVYYNRLDAQTGLRQFSLITKDTVWVGGSCEKDCVFQDEAVDESMFLPGDTVITVWYEKKEVEDSLGFRPYIYYVEHTDTLITQAFQDSTPDFDAVRMWIAPFDGCVKFQSYACLTENLQTARFASHVTDGVRVSIQKNQEVVLGAKILYPDTEDEEANRCWTYSLDSMPVSRGDRFYFRMESLDKRNYDKVSWDPVFTYTKINRYGVIPDGSLRDADSMPIYQFSPKEDFLINTDRKYYIALDSTSVIKIESSLKISRKLSDTITLHILCNNQDVIPPVNYSPGTVGDFPLPAITLNVRKNDSLFFEISCPTNVRWQDLDWTVGYHYISATDTNVNVWGMLNDTIPEPLIRYDTLTPHLTAYPKPVLPTNVFRADQDYNLLGRTIVLEFTNYPSHEIEATLSIKDEQGLCYRETLVFKTNGTAVISGEYDLQQDKTYFLDLYSSDYEELSEARCGFIDKGWKLPIGLHVTHNPDMGIFGPLYRNWGQFAYQGSPMDTNINQNYLRLSDEALNPYDASLTGDGQNTVPQTMSADEILTAMDTLCYDPAADHFQMALPDYKAKRWLGYGNLVFFSKDTMSNTYSSAPDTIDVTLFPVPYTTRRAAAKVVNKTMRTKNNTINLQVGVTNIGLEGNASNTDSIPLSFSGSIHWGHSDVTAEFTDMNGDGFPDAVSDAQVQYSKPQGGLSSLKCGFSTAESDSAFETTRFIGGGVSSGGSFTHTTTIPSNSKKNAKHSLGGSAGINCSNGFSNDHATTQWTDLNGDGLPDRIVQTKDDTAVYYNLGYSYLKYAPAGPLPMRQGTSSNIGVSQSGSAQYAYEYFVDNSANSSSFCKNFNLFETSLSGGSSFQDVSTTGISTLADLNGDGLPDEVSDGGTGLSVRFNTGRGFLPSTFLPTDVYKSLDKTATAGRDLNVALSFGFTIGAFPIKFVINPQFDLNHKMNKTKSCFTDVNGDGLLDYVVEENTHTIIVHYNQSGKANLLKSVTNLAGGGMAMDYALSDYMGYDCPSRTQVLSSLAVYDGLAGDGCDTVKLSFEYDSAYYDRFERTSYGFGVVKTNSIDSDNTVYRTVTEKYINRFYKFRNLKTYELLADGAGNKYVEKFFTFVPKEIATGIVVNEEVAFCYGESYPAINQEEVRYYEGGNTARVVTRKHYEHGPYGNLTKYTDAGQVGMAEDSVIVTMTYHPDSADKNLTGMVDSIVAKDYRDSLLRKKDCIVNYETGQIRKLRLYNDHDTAVTSFWYDTFGNLIQSTGPANDYNQRITIRYTYDGLLHTYPVSVRNVPFGYVSTATYDLCFGRPLTVTDINGNTINYRYDLGGRLESLTAPGDTGWTIKHDYWIVYDSNAVSADSFPWARTQHFDIQHPDNPLNTTVITDGLGRVVQTKKDADIEGQEVSLISGKVLYDAFGRPSEQQHPFTDGSLDTLFKTNSHPTAASTTRYDILDRPVRVVLPYGIVTTTEYGFATHGTFSCFRTETTDPKGNVLLALSNARGLILEQTASSTATTMFDYDALGQLLRSTDPDGLTTEYQYDKFGQLIERQHPDAGTDLYSYDAMGNMLRHTNGRGQTITYRYDHNRLTDVVYPDNPANNVHYTYGDSVAGNNSKGRIVLLEDGSGFQTFKYGKLGEVIENIRTFALPFENQTYTFRMQYEYDPFNRIQSMLYPDSERVEYGYNLGGMLTKVTGTVTRKTSDLVVPVLLQGGGLLQGGDGVQGLGPGGDHAVENTVTIRYPYLDSIVYNQFELRDSVVYGNGTRVRYVYDSLQRLTALRSYTADDELMQDIAYHYDSVGNILDIENSAAALGNGLGGTYRQEYTYDNLYRLTHATGWWDCRPDHLTLRDTVDMRYSKNGRIIRKRMSAETLKNMQLNLVRYDRQYQYPSVYSNKVNRVTDAISGTSHQFEWESGGNLMRHANPDQNYDRRLWWTEDNRLQFVKDNGSTGAYYQYDAGGDRTYKLLYHKTTGSLNGVQTDYYTLDDATLYVSPYLVVTPQGYTKHYYAETERITTQLGKYRFAVVDSCVAGSSLAAAKLQAAITMFSTDSFPTPTAQLGYLHSLTNHPNTASTLYFYHPDHLGSASWITNIYGRTIQHLYYLPWGEDFVDQRTGSFSSMYTFSAKEKDTETGLSYFGSRYYSSDLSIWLSVDPMSDKYPSLSPYTYCADNPVKLVDPNGEDYKLFITGDDEETANEAFKQLQASTNLILKRDESGCVTIDGGEVRNENDMLLQKAINDENVTVTVNAINGTSDDYVMGGSFMGNEVVDKVIPLFASKPYEVIAYLLTRHVFTKQTVDPYETAILDDIGYLRYIPGISETKAFKGQTMLHEVTESYCGGIDALFSGVSAGNAIVSPNAYKSAHNAATYPPDIMMEQSDVLKIFRERRGK